METRLLPVRLTDGEKLVRGKQMSRAELDIKALEEEKKTVTARYKPQIDELKAQIQKLAREVDTGTQDRLVEVTWERDEATGVMKLHRVDTGDIVEHRPMTISEKNGDLFPHDIPDGEPIPEAMGAAIGAPVTVALVHADDWKLVTPGQQKRFTEMLDRYEISFAAVEGIYRTTPLTVGGRGLAAVEMLLREFGCKYEKGDVTEAVDADQGDDDEEGDEDGGDDAAGEGGEPEVPRATVYIKAGPWERASAEARTKLLAVLDRHGLATVEEEGELRTIAMPVGGVAMAEFEALAKQLGVPTLRGEPEPLSVAGLRDQAYRQLLAKIDAAPDRAELEQVWALIEDSLGHKAIARAQYEALEAAWEARSQEVPDRAEPTPVKKGGKGPKAK
jgi:hypothetical protein